MTHARFLIDDAVPCRTQRAVLSVFADHLEGRALGEIVRSSRLTDLPAWRDVPETSSSRLALRLWALGSSPDRLTVFMPGHVIPGDIAPAETCDRALALQGFPAVADLDLFVADNAHQELRRFHEFREGRSDYESLSRYDQFTVAELPAWLVSGGLTSALPFGRRPWYSAFAPTRMQWMEWVQRALERGLLDIEMVNEDIRAGLVRPSLRQDVESLTREQALPVLPDTTPDAVFVPPELRLTDEQFLLLHSRALQERTIRFGKQRKGTGKAEKGGTGKGRLKSIRRSLRFVRRLPQLGLRAAYLVYSVTARPAVTRLRARSRAKS